MLQAVARPPYIFASSAFKTNGIYGIAPGLINAPFARMLGVAVAEMALERGVSAIVLGRDCRINGVELVAALQAGLRDRKSTRLNSSHVKISYSVFCLKKKKE